MDRLPGDDDVVLSDDVTAPASPLGARSRLPSLRSPAVLAVGAVALAFAVGAGAGLLRGDDEPRALPVASPSPSPSPSAAEPTAEPTAPTSAPPSPEPSPADGLDPSCTRDAPSEAVCRFVRALLTGDLSDLTEQERGIADVENDLPDAPFAVASCELEGDVTVLCEVAFDDPERISAGFRLQPSNGTYDAATGEVVVEPGQTLTYEVVEAVGMRRDRPAEPSEPPPAAPSSPPEDEGDGTTELVLGGQDLGVTEIGAPADEAVQALTRVLGPPVRDPATTVTCISAEREVEWASFRLAVEGDRVTGWLSRDPRLRTPSGFGIGTTVAQMQDVLGDDLSVFEPNADNGATFAVADVDLGGGLTGTGPSDSVESFFTSACAGP